MQNIIERLGYQSDAFQESFDILSRAKNLDELAGKFFHVLRGNLLVVNAAVFYKKSESADWTVLFSKIKGQKIFCDDLLNNTSGNEINAIDDAEFKICIKHVLIDKSVFGILLGAKLDQTDYTEFDRIALQFFIQQLDSAYQFFISRKKEKQLLFSLNHRVLQLNSLVDTGIELARLQDGSQLLSLALERVLALANASKGLLRVKKGTTVLEKIYYPFKFKSKKIEQEKYHISTSFKFSGKRYTFYLFEKESRDGLIAFDGTDQLLLDAFARQVHVSLENHFLHLQSLEKERVEKEISLAGDIQKKLIPEILPEIAGYDHFGINIPTKFIGGDYYDCIPLNDGRFMFIMADVSGKGVAAGLLVSTLHASVHAYMDNPFELPSLVTKLNEVIWNSSTLEKYITAFFTVLEPESGRLESVNAGHNPIYLSHANGDQEELKTGGIPLGMMGAPFPYESVFNTMEAGSSLLMYTDGVTEAMNEKEEEYDDFYPLAQFLKKQKTAAPHEFIKRLMDDLHAFTGATPQSDDITALYLLRSPAS